MFGDPGFSQRFQLSAVNSINWARLAAQIVYYFYAAVRLGAPERDGSRSRCRQAISATCSRAMSPRRWGCRSRRLIVATNVNDILHRALSAGDYSTGTVTPTHTPSMDIQVSSNFERLLFDLHGRDAAALGVRDARLRDRPADGAPATASRSRRRRFRELPRRS